MLLPILRAQLPIIAWLQGFAGLAGLMKAFTFAGSEEFFLLLLPPVYWCISRTLGRRLALLFLGGEALNPLLKVAFALPRPYWLGGVKALGHDASFGLPSGHAQDAFAVWPFLALQARRHRAAWLGGALLLAACIALSRVYLGVHFPLDVVGGALVGVAWLLLFRRVIGLLEARVRRWPLGAQLGAATLFALALIGAFALARGIGLNAGSTLRAPRSDGPSDPFEWQPIFTRAGALWGLMCGLALAQRVAPFEARGTVAQKLLRLVIGFAGLLALRFGLSALFPDGAAPLELLLRFLRYALTTAWVVLGAPWVFARLTRRVADGPLRRA